jgi:hypothetical protein
VTQPTIPLHRARRRLPDLSQPGIADARLLPDVDFEAAWRSIVLPDDVKSRMRLRRLRSDRPRVAAPRAWRPAL